MNEPRVVESVTNECQSLGRAHESSSARAEQLIACLEGEIAKRDETIARLEPQLNRAIQANYDLREELAACRIAVENCDLFLARIVELERAEKNDAIAYKAVLERQDELRAELAELAALKAQGVVMPDVNLAAKALCSRHAMICGVDEDDQWKEYGQEFITDAETVLANSRLCAATVLEVNAHCAVIPEPYGWVAAGSFYTDRESAICAAEKTPCIYVYSRPQMNALENRSLQRQELAEELARQLNASCAEIRNMRNLYAAPVSEAKAQDTVGEVVGWYRLDRPYEMTSYPSVCATWHKLGAPVAPLYAAPAAPAADAGLVEALDYQALFDAIAAATSVYANGAINISVQAFRDALAAHRTQGVV